MDLDTNKAIVPVIAEKKVLLNFSTAPSSKKNMVDVDNSIRNGEDSGVDLCNDGNHESKEILH